MRVPAAAAAVVEMSRGPRIVRDVTRRETENLGELYNVNDRYIRL